ncbi:DNA-binding transcriptional LysR family regulator [Rhodoligotrophos appendicifer]|uniref:LysR family transcriptional regulator n=1 Tax=Rhodoligotrophos appendicifer TaxID=987056 RepID=UPI0014789174|nr:LysR family transcriptional regulator [Rhodoligotrophos appendicifer]
MNIVLAKTFLELLNARNFNKAADRLCVTQSTVTVRIAALEEQLGQQLFTRDKSGVELTVAGRKFQPYAELLLQTWQHARQELALSDSQSVMFSVGINSALWEGFAGPWLLELQKAQPNVALNVDVGASSGLLEKLAQGFLDAALLYEPNPRKDIVIHELMDEDFILVSTYPRRAERWNPHYVYVQWGEDFQHQHRAIMPNEITPPVSFTDGRIALDFILARGGSGYFPLRQIRELLDEEKLFVVEDAGFMTRRIYIAHTEALHQQDWFAEAMDSLLRHRDGIQLQHDSFRQAIHA